MFLTILVFVIILGLLIFVHEWGHFLLARATGIKVEEFAFGFPPRLLAWKRGETEYALNLLPFGGYVRLLGEDGKSNDPRAFNRQSVLKRLGVVVAGVFMNLVLAVIVFWVGFTIGMVPVVSQPADLGGSQAPQLFVVGIVKDSAAEAIGLLQFDIIQGFGSSDELRLYTQSQAGQEITLTIIREGQEMTKQVTLGSDASGPLGVYTQQVTKVKLGFFGAGRAAFIETGKTVVATFHFLGNFFSQLVSRGQVAEGVTGPVGIFRITGQTVQLGFTYVLQLLGILSVNLALLNILPIPALDGGRGLFVVLEGIVRRKVVREEIEGVIHAVGFILLLALILFITYSDIVNL
ncbi:MAG: site-2 protease family protein [Patescibacteria group bacterium]